MISLTLKDPNKKIIVTNDASLYKWSKRWHQTQKKFFVEPIKLRREKQIEDFILLNGFKKVKFKIDNDVFTNFNFVEYCQTSKEAELTVITDQKFSRYPCRVLIEKIREQVDKCSRLYLCLNSHYINIDNSYHDHALNDNMNIAITQWLKQSLPELDIIDLSLDQIDHGESFTWVIPDKHYYIRSAHD